MTKAHNVYIASGVENRALISALAYLLEDQFDNLSVVGNWWKTAPVEDVTRRAYLDYVLGVDQADFVIGVYPGGPGTTSEVAYALGRGKPVIWFSDAADEDDDPLIVGLIRHRKLSNRSHAQGPLHSAVVRDINDLLTMLRTHFNDGIAFGDAERLLRR